MANLTFGTLIAKHIMEQLEVIHDNDPANQSLDLHRRLDEFINVALEDLKKSKLMKAVWIP